MKHFISLLCILGVATAIGPSTAQGKHHNKHEKPGNRPNHGGGHNRPNYGGQHRPNHGGGHNCPNYGGQHRPNHGGGHNRPRPHRPNYYYSNNYVGNYNYYPGYGLCEARMQLPLAYGVVGTFVASNCRQAMTRCQISLARNQSYNPAYLSGFCFFVRWQ